MTVLLVPADFFDPRRPDEHFAPEAAAARDLGLEVATLDEEKLGDGSPALRVADLAGADVVYRGWMMTPASYEETARQVAERNGRMRTVPALFQAAHQLPGWYELFAGSTAESVWTEGDDEADVRALLARLGGGPAIVKDFVKSEKHRWDEACFIPDVADQSAALTVIRCFRELRGDAFAGGVVLRRFETYDGHEARTWWVNGKLLLTTAHPDTPDATPTVEIPDAVSAAVAALGSPFLTVDFARRSDGAWRVVEAGDGQVSDRPASCPATAFVEALFV